VSKKLTQFAKLDSPASLPNVEEKVLSMPV
jgi:hypothetical protein